MSHKDFQTIQTEATDKPSQHPLDKINLYKADWDSIRSELGEVTWDQELTQSMTVLQMYNRLESIVTSTCIKFAPERRGKVLKNRGIPRSRLTLINRKKKINSKLNYLKYVKKITSGSKFSKLQKEKDEIEAKIKRSHELEGEETEKEVIKKIKSNRKAFFNYAKKFNKSSSKIGPLKDKNGILQADPEAKANILQNQYTKVFSKPMDVPETEENIEIKMRT